MSVDVYGALSEVKFKYSMNILRSFADIQKLEKGAVYALPTDTVYGLSCAIDDEEAVAKIRALKERDGAKPLIVLVATMRDVERCGVQLSPEHTAFLKRVWPGPVSVVCVQKEPLLRHISQTGTIAVRMPLREDLHAFLARVGPIVSTSANTAGKQPATTCAEVQAYFPEGITAIVDTGVCDNPPSTVVQILR